MYGAAYVSRSLHLSQTSEWVPYNFISDAKLSISSSKISQDIHRTVDTIYILDKFTFYTIDSIGIIDIRAIAALSIVYRWH